LAENLFPRFRTTLLTVRTERPRRTMTAENDNTPLPEDLPPESGSGDEAAVREVMRVLRMEAEAHKDRALRALAEVENVRKRLERERDEARTYSVTRFARDLLSVADNLSRALSALPAEARTRAEDSIKLVLDGVEATERQAILGRHGVKPIEAQGVRFDPNVHQAIAEIPGAGAEPGTVVNVVQSGYLIGDRLLRPAMVTIAKAGTEKPAPEGYGPNGAAARLDTKI
jgi:molecular chaperone GrpE